MLIGLVSYFMLLFGSAQIESFYIIDLDKGIKKYVTTIPRRQDAEAIVSVYASTYKEFNREHQKQFKELLQKNTDYNTPEQWYQDFFKKTLDDRKKLQSSFISGRLRLQEIINQEEWDKILEMTTANLEKLVEKNKKKKEKKEGKKKGNDPYMRISNTIKETIPPGEKQTGSLEALANFKEKYKMIGNSYENLNSNEAKVLGDRQATREDLQEICNSLNKLRRSLIDSYVELLFNLKDNATEQEWSIIVKDLNKF